MVRLHCGMRTLIKAEITRSLYSLVQDYKLVSVNFDNKFHTPTLSGMIEVLVLVLH